MQSDFERNEAICDAFEAEWTEGRRPLIESFMGKDPDPLLLRELLRIEIEFRRASDEAPNPKDYLYRFTDWQREIYAAFRLSPPPNDNEPVCLILAGLLSAREGLVTERELVGRLVDWAGREDPRPSFAEFLDKSFPDTKNPIVRAGHPLFKQVREWVAENDNDKVRCLTSLQSTQVDAVRSLLVHERDKINDARTKAGLDELLDDLRHVKHGRYIVEEVAKELDTRKNSEKRAAGGFGVVVLAHDRELARIVAVKELAIEHVCNGDAYERFIQEPKIAGCLDHPGIVKIFGLDTYSDGRPYFAMPYFKGGNLQQAIAALHSPQHHADRDGPKTLTLRDLVERMVDVCRAVAYAHSRGVLHRDLKPGNIVLGAFGEAIVVDWGLAKVLPPEPSAKHRVSVAIERQKVIKDPLLVVTAAGLLESQNGVALGTLAYSSPRQATGDSDGLTFADDIYSLGATLYEVITGVRAFRVMDDGPSQGERVRRTQTRPSRKGSETSTWASSSPRKALIKKIVDGEFALPSKVNPDVPPDLERICLKAMARESWERYHSAEELADDLERWLAGEPVLGWLEPRRLGSQRLVSREPRWRRVRRWVSRHSGPVTITLLSSLVGLISFLAFQVFSRANVLASELLTCPMAEFRELATKLKSYHLLLIRDKLRTESSSSNRDRRLRSMLALLREEPSFAPELFKFLLEESRADEVLVIRDELKAEGYKKRFAGELWNAFLRGPSTGVAGPEQGQQAEPPGLAQSEVDKIRIRAAGALVALDPDRFEHESDLRRFVSLYLVQPSPSLAGDWADVFKNVKKWMRPNLLAIYEGRASDRVNIEFDDEQVDSHKPVFIVKLNYTITPSPVIRGRVERSLAFAILMKYAEEDGPDGKDTVANLSTLIGAADPMQFREINARIGSLQSNVRTAVETLERSLDERPEPDAGAAHRFGQRAAALIAFGRPEKAWPWLTFSEDPGRRRNHSLLAEVCR